MFDFYVDEDQGIVVAVLNNVRDYVAFHVSKRTNVDMFDAWNLAKKFNIVDKIVGKACCNMEMDEFDEELGKKIAGYRARQKLNAALTRMYAMMAYKAHMDAQQYIEFSIKYAQSIDQDDRYLDPVE